VADDAIDESRRCRDGPGPNIAGGGARSLMSYIDSAGLVFCGPLVGLAASVGNKEYDCFRACPREFDGESAVGSGMVGMIAFCSTAFGFEANGLNLFGERKGGLLSDSMLMTRPFSGPTKLARLSALLCSSRVGVRGPDTGSTK
jgi:hypothetical protein